MLELRNITKTYDSIILSSINFMLEEGKSVAIVGSSGTGKTTLLNIASLLDVPTSGEIFYFKKKVEAKDYSEIRRNFISFVYQQHNLMPEFSIFENIKLVCEIKNSYNKNTVIKLLEEVGLTNVMHKTPDQLSGGQKQRASIVRAIACGSKIIFADEPTGNLDSYLADVSSNLLINLAKNQGIAIFLITHNNDIAKKCDAIFTIKDFNLTKHF